MQRPIANVDDLEYMEWSHGEQFAAKLGLMSRQLGSRGLGYNLTVVPAGKKAFPCHSHRVNDEMFFILAGQGEVRIGDQRHAIRPGDAIACPPGGPKTAHQIINTSDEELRYLAVSTTRSPEVAEYPDSDKCGVIIEEEADENGLPSMWRLMMKREDTRTDYWEGE